MAARNDYYEVLGVARDATEAQIRAAYKKLARKYHPDVNPGDKKAEERFKQIAEAYAVLGNPGKRTEYDRRGPEGFDLGFDPSEIFRRARAGGVDGIDLDLGSIFGDLFGAGAGRRARPARGADLEAELTIDFEDAVRGVTLPLSLSRTVPCGDCGGSGVRAGSQGGACPDCGGSGHRQISRGSMRMSTTCRRCGGTGRTSGPPCPTCSGRGNVPRTESLQVRIPPGVREGSRVRLAGKGDAGSQGGPTGDLYVLIHVRPHPRFRRDGDDLILDLPISLTEAALGAKVEVSTLDGSATMTIPPGTRSGQRFRLRSKGTPRPGRSGRGDLFVDVQIVPPKNLDRESRELLQRFAERNPQQDLRDGRDEGERR